MKVKTICDAIVGFRAMLMTFCEAMLYTLFIYNMWHNDVKEKREKAEAGQERENYPTVSLPRIISQPCAIRCNTYTNAIYNIQFFKILPLAL